MNRRRVIVGTASALPVALPGCPDTSDDGEQRGGFPDLSATGDEIPAGHESGLSASVELVRQYSRDEPARLRISLVNRSDTAREITFGPSLPFSTLRGGKEEGAAVAVLVPDDRTHVHVERAGDSSSEPAEPDDGCWQIEGVARDDIAQYERFDSGGSLTEAYSVYALTENGDCLPPGEYRFEDSWVNRPGTSPEFSVDWGFTLAVEA